ncbi:MAG: death-on-curing protein [Candidatus Binatia bacterium]
MKEPQWLLPEVVLAVHEHLLSEFGGSAGVRDLGLLESALARPEHLFAYQSATLCELAASYAFGIVKNHPFIDGNKRTGFAAAAVFIELNGRQLTASEADALVNTLALAAGELDEAGFAAWLAANSVAN